jgi:hypothetical protein
MRCTLIRGGLAALAIAAFTAAPARAAEFEKFIGKDTDVLMSVDVKGLLESSAAKKLLIPNIEKGLKADAEAQRLLAALGLDPLKDVTRFTALGSADPAANKSLIVVEGKFDPAKIETVATLAAKDKSDNLAVLKEDGKTLFKITLPQAPEPMYAQIANAQTILVASTKDELKDATGLLASGKRTEPKKEFKELLDQTDQKATMFMVANIKDKLGQIPLPDPNIGKTLEKLHTVTMVLNVKDDAKLDVTFGSADEAAGKEFGAIMEQGIAQAKQFVPLIILQQEQLKPLGELVNTLKTETKGKSVVLSASLSADAMEKLAEAAKKGKEN